MQVKDIQDEPILSIIDRIRAEKNRCSFTDDFDALAIPRKLMLAKMANMIRRKLITGCTCGCRGDFEREPIVK